MTRHLKDIEAKMAGRKDCLDVLPDLLKYAIEHVPFYKGIERPELQCFPVVNKKSFVDCLSDHQSPLFKEDELRWASTSGTIGMPFKSSQNLDKRNRTTADLIYFHRTNGWNVGDRYVFLRAWTTDYIVPNWKKRMQNCVAFDLIHFGDAAKESMRQTMINDNAARVLIGYASGVENFLQYLEEKGDTPDLYHLKAIFTDSDMLSDVTKSKLENLFGCPVINRYSNEEQGVLGCTSAYDGVFRLNTASYLFELLKLDSDEPAAAGEMGRVVVTDLYNHATPFIRYDTNDLAISDDPDRLRLKTLRCLQGRLGDLIKDPDGNMVCASNIGSYIREFYDLRQYQLIQDGCNHYQFKVVCDPDAYADSALIDMVRKVLGPAANIDVQHVDHIPFEKSGKFVTVKNQCR